MLSSRCTRLIPLALLGAAGMNLNPARADFEPQTIDSQIGIGYGLAIADVDGDGKQDIILADQAEIAWYQNPTWEKKKICGRLTLRDNVCLAARDIDGDGKAEIAVGAQWNPGETSNEKESGAVFWLQRPENEGDSWKSVKLPHEPTVHRMRWVKRPDGTFVLVVQPLHGRGNKNGEGAGSKVFAYEKPADPDQEWKRELVDDSLHMSHNLDLLPAAEGDGEEVWLCGKEGVRRAVWTPKGWSSKAVPMDDRDPASGEIRVVRSAGGNAGALVQPMHGNRVLFGWRENGESKSKILDESLASGHALAVADFLGAGHFQVAAGWREQNADGKIGVKLYAPTSSDYSDEWTETWLDDTMACEDLQAADLDGDGKIDLVASGRASKNVVIYWNR